MTATNRRMWDSVNLHGIPKPVPDDDIVAYYIDGNYSVGSVVEVERLFPGTRLNPIDATGNNPHFSRSIDIEQGLVQASVLENYITQFNAHNPCYENGGRLLVYCNRSTIPSVRVGTGKYQLGEDYYLWVATGDGTMATADSLGLPENSVTACQYYWGQTFDLSVVYTEQFL